MPILSVAQGGALKSLPTIESLSISVGVCFMHYEAILLDTHLGKIPLLNKLNLLLLRNIPLCTDVYFFLILLSKLAFL